MAESIVSKGLTTQQVQLFRHNGYLKLPNCLPEETIQELKKSF